MSRRAIYTSFVSTPAPWLLTERLALRRFTPDDADWFARLYADPEITRFLGGPKTRQQADNLLLTRAIDYYDVHPGLGLWVTTERSSGDRVGFHLLNNVEGETVIQVGYVLVESAWGKGFATEMAEALLRHGFVDLGLPAISGMASLDHVASHRVLEKIGLERRGERAFRHPMYAKAGPLAWFEREADAWLASRAG